MEKCKIKICALVLLLALAASFMCTSAAPVPNISPIAKEKLTTLLTDVLKIDLTKYTVIEEGGGVTYPSEYGGTVKKETVGVKYNSTDSQVDAAVEFLNGHIRWLNVLSGRRTSIIHYLQEPSTSAVAETRNILERYKTYAAKYGIDTAHVAAALSLLDQASDGPPPSDIQMLNDMSGFAPSEAVEGNMQQTTSQTGVGYMYTFNEVDVPNRAIGVNFGRGITFHDTWGLYTVAYASVITEEEAKQMALETAENYEVRLMRDDNTSYVVYPDWSNPTMEIGLLMIPGEIFNTQLNNALGSVDSGSATRNPLGLYPFWQATVYFTEPVGNLDGVQVGIWGDTKEIAYVHTYGMLGDSGDTDGADQNPEPLNLGFAIAIAAMATAAAATMLLVAIQKRRK